MLSSLEIFGYAASVVTAASLTMSNVWKLRWLNMIGAAGLAVYSALLAAWPLAVVNTFIVFVDLWYIWEMYSRKDMFTLLRTCREDQTLLPAFLSTYSADIAKFFPAFQLDDIDNPRCLFILRNLMPVGLFVYENEGKGTARIHLDYVIASHRDLANAHFLFNNNFEKFLEEGFREFVVRDATPVHERFVRRLGFAPSLIDPKVLVKTLAAGTDLKGKPAKPVSDRVSCSQSCPACDNEQH